MRKLALALVLLPSIALAQSGVQWTRDRDATMVSKDVAGERWAITYRLSDQRVTGNVFRADGPPAFVDCARLVSGPEEIQLRCFGADACVGDGCGDYVLLGEVTLPRSFFLPPGPIATPTPAFTPATPRPIGTPRPTPPATGTLRGLIGTWLFRYTILSTFESEYRLRQTQTTSDGTVALVGVDEFDDVAFVVEIQDLVPGSPIPYQFGLFDRTILGCELHLFDQTGGDRVEGLTFIILGEDCDLILGDGNPLVGTRTSRSASLGTGTVASSGASSDEAVAVAPASPEVVEHVQPLLDALRGIE